jgi:PAS domain S-box-containing protein
VEGGNRLVEKKRVLSPKEAQTLSHQELLARLSEAEETLRAIRSGEVDAFVVNGRREGKVFTLQGADHTYRAFVERMNEGTAVLSSDHIVLHSNGRFARFLGRRLQSVIGSSLMDLVLPDDHLKLRALLQHAAQKNCRGEIRLRPNRGTPISVHLSLNPLRLNSTRAVCLIASDLSEMKRAEGALVLQREQLRALAERLQWVREEDRKRVARDLHDQIGQILTAMKMDMTWMSRHLPESEVDVLARLRESIQSINDGVKAVRTICSGLRPGVLDDLGLAAAIEWQASEFSSRNHIQCQVSVPPVDLHLDGDRATATFRIFQECLTNVVRHAKAKSVRASLIQENESILLVVEDDGIGFCETELSNTLGSLGLLGMKERAQFCGGDVQIKSSPGNGTTVTVRVPVDIPRAERSETCIS